MLNNLQFVSKDFKKINYYKFVSVYIFVIIMALFSHQSLIQDYTHYLNQTLGLYKMTLGLCLFVSGSLPLIYLDNFKSIETESILITLLAAKKPIISILLARIVGALMLSILSTLLASIYFIQFFPNAITVFILYSISFCLLLIGLYTLLSVLFEKSNIKLLLGLSIITIPFLIVNAPLTFAILFSLIFPTFILWFINRYDNQIYQYKLKQTSILNLDKQQINYLTLLMVKIQSRVLRFIYSLELKVSNVQQTVFIISYMKIFISQLFQLIIPLIIYGLIDFEFKYLSLFVYNMSIMAFGFKLYHSHQNLIKFNYLSKTQYTKFFIISSFGFICLLSTLTLIYIPITFFSILNFTIILPITYLTFIIIIIQIKNIIIKKVHE